MNKYLRKIEIFFRHILTYNINYLSISVHKEGSSYAEKTVIKEVGKWKVAAENIRDIYKLKIIYVCIGIWFSVNNRKSIEKKP